MIPVAFFEKKKLCCQVTQNLFATHDLFYHPTTPFMASTKCHVTSIFLSFIP